MTTTEDLMRYDLMAQEALRGMVRLALERAATDEGLPGEHQIYVTFVTEAEGVDVPARLREQYPEDMTIVFQPNHFSDLVVTLEGFEVSMTFNQKIERLKVPYSAVVTLFDPTVRFGLQFPRPGDDPAGTAEANAPAEPDAAEDQEQEGDTEEAPDAQVVSLDAFRKK